MKNIYLCGFMGCGKTTVGKELAKQTGMSFLDTDKEIERRSEKSVSEIFSEYGELAFRLLERELLQTISGDESLVVAMGGGMIIPSCNSDYASKTGCVILLDVPFEECYRRIANEKTRPLAEQMIENELEELYWCRMKNYRAAAEIIVDANCRPTVCAENIKRTIMQRKGSF